jgi:hypothetical protein
MKQTNFKGVLNMKINVERLIGAMQEHFDNVQSYTTECKKKDWWRRTQEERERVSWYERNEHGSSNEVTDICAILNIDINKLYQIARITRNWEKKRNWQFCFPISGHEEQILKYLEAHSPYEGPEIDYIHQKINEKGAKSKAA